MKKARRESGLFVLVPMTGVELVTFALRIGRIRYTLALISLNKSIQSNHLSLYLL